MRRKRRKIVVTVTETWTFLFDDVGATDPPPRDPPALAVNPVPPLDAPPLAVEASDVPAVDAPGSSSAVEHGE